MGERKRHPCPVCGHLTIDDPCDWNSCDVCCWEDDMIASTNSDWQTSPANRGMRISEAQANYRLFGVAHLTCLDVVRPPRSEEIPETPFEIWPQAAKLVESVKREQKHDALPGHDRRTIESVVIPRAITALQDRSDEIRKRALRILDAIATLPLGAEAARARAQEEMG